MCLQAWVALIALLRVDRTTTEGRVSGRALTRCYDLSIVFHELLVHFPDKNVFDDSRRKIFFSGLLRTNDVAPHRFFLSFFLPQAVTVTVEFVLRSWTPSDIDPWRLERTGQSVGRVQIYKNLVLKTRPPVTGLQPAESRTFVGLSALV